MSICIGSPGRHATLYGYVCDILAELPLEELHISFIRDTSWATDVAAWENDLCAQISRFAHVPNTRFEMSWTPEHGNRVAYGIESITPLYGEDN